MAFRYRRKESEEEEEEEIFSTSLNEYKTIDSVEEEYE